MRRRLGASAIGLIIVASVALVHNTGTAGPIAYIESNSPRRWPKPNLEVAWTGELPVLPGDFGQTAGIDGLVREAFDKWSVKPPGNRSPNVAGGRTFTYSELAERKPVNTPEELSAVPRLDIVVVFTNSYATVGKERAAIGRPFDEGSGGVTFERQPNMTSQDLSPTIIVMNNDAVKGSVPKLQALLLHEVGHALGLDHSPINWPGYSLTLLGIVDFLPAMTPFPTRRELHPDDIAALAGLYRAGSFNKDYGWIEGWVVNRKNPSQLINGVQVVAIRLGGDNRTVPDDSVRYQNVFASVTPHGGSRAGGRFYIVAPPGWYRVIARSINTPFDLYRVSPFLKQAEGEVAMPIQIKAGTRSLVQRLPMDVTEPSSTP
jgi:hypothetical protein